MTTEQKINDNDQLTQYMCTDEYHKWFGGMLITDGVKAMGEMYQCYWLIDIVASYQPTLRGEEFQVWEFKKSDKGKGVVTCEDGNGRVLKTQKIGYTDIKADIATIWVEGNVALLPSEH